MSTSIRLSLSGKRNRPSYRVVVSETRYKRNGKALDILGTYNPNLKPPLFKIDQQKLEGWVSKGAIVSAGLGKLLKSYSANSKK